MIKSGVFLKVVFLSTLGALFFCRNLLEDKGSMIMNLKGIVAFNK